jgi:PAS domain S-box-containing protein
MLDAVGEAVMATDADGRITYWNAAAERLYGWREEEVLGRRIVDVTPTEQSASDAETLMDAFARGETWTGRFEVRDKEGRRFPARVTNTPLYDEYGAFAGVIGVSSDISEELAGIRGQARARQQATVASLARAALRDVTLAQIFDHTVDVVGELLDVASCAVLLRKPGGDRLFVEAGRGLKAGFIGQEVPQGASEDASERLVGARLWSGDAELHGLEAMIPGRHDAYGVLGVYAAEERVFDEDEDAFLNAAAGVLGSAIARHDVERQLQQAQKLEAAGQLASGLAHDLNNVLTVITTHAELLRRHGTDPASTAHAGAILDAAHRAAGLSRRLLSFVRPHSGRREAMALGPALHGLQSLLRALMGPRIQLTFEVGDDLWIAVDDDELEQLVINLVVNARDSLSDGGRVQVVADVLTSDPVTDPQPPPSGQWVRIRVMDNGVGMDEDTARRAFDPFFTTKPEGTGTGLGLATVGGLATDLGGRAYIHSRPGEGTTATVLLPRDVSVPAMEPTQADPGPEEATAAASASARILLVEDQDSVRSVLGELLTEQGYDVHAESDAERALQSEVRPDLLLTDVQLPGMSGIDLAEAVGKRWPDLPVVLLSGFAKPAAATGRFLPKPFRPAELLRVVHATLADAARSAAGGEADRAG